MTEEKSLRMLKKTSTVGALGLLFALAMIGRQPLAQAQVNVAPNPGFEREAAYRKGTPADWAVKTHAATPGGVARLDAEEKHSGKYSVRIRHLEAKDFTKFRARISVKPNTDYVARFWVKTDPKDPLLNAAGTPSGMELVLSGLTSGKTVATSARIRDTGGQWRRFAVPFSSGKNKHVLVQFYRVKNKGTLWLDDVEITAASAPGKKPTARAETKPVYTYKKGDPKAVPVDWDCSKGLRMEVAFAFRGYNLTGENRPLITMRGTNNLGNPILIGVHFEARGRLCFYVLQYALDSWTPYSATRKTQIWVRGETHTISCGWGEIGGDKKGVFDSFALYADGFKGTLRRGHRGSDFYPRQITSLTRHSEAGEVKDLSIRLSGEGIGPRTGGPEAAMKVIPPEEHSFLAGLCLPLDFAFVIKDSQLYKRAFARIVLECPLGVTPINNLNVWRLYFGPVPYLTFRGAVGKLRKNGTDYRRFVFHIPRTKPGYVRADLKYPCVLPLHTILPPGDIPPMYLYAAWEGGRQEALEIKGKVLPFQAKGIQFKKLPIGLWGTPFNGDIRSYCKNLGVNQVSGHLEEDGFPAVIKDACSRLHPNVEWHPYPNAIWWKHKWPKQIAFTRPDGTQNARYPCLSYRGSEWFQDRELARKITLKGLPGITLDIECEIYNGCFCERCRKAFKSWLGKNRPDLAYSDPRDMSKNPAKRPGLRKAWTAFTGRMMSEYYISLCEGMKEAAEELGRKEPPSLNVYNDTRYGRKGADLAYLFSRKGLGVRLFHAPPFYYKPHVCGNQARELTRRYPGAYLAPYFGRVPHVPKHSFEDKVYEVFGNGGRGLFIFCWRWLNAEEYISLSRGLRNINKIEGLFTRSHLLDKPFDLSERVRIRGVGDGDEKFIMVAQHSKKHPLQGEVTFSIPTVGPARVVNLATGKLVADITPARNQVTVSFAGAGAIPLYVRPEGLRE